MIILEEVGNIFARLAIADDNFLVGALQSVRKAGDAMLPGDAEKLEAWARFIQALRATTQNSEKNIKSMLIAASMAVLPFIPKSKKNEAGLFAHKASLDVYTITMRINSLFIITWKILLQAF